MRVAGPGEIRPWSTGVTDVAQEAANISETTFDRLERDGVEDTAGSGRRRRPHGQDTEGVAPAAVTENIESTSDELLKVGVRPSVKQLVVGKASVTSSGSDRPTMSTAVCLQVEKKNTAKDDELTPE